MFNKIILKNFRSFDELEVDFTGTNNISKKSVYIYGENGSGKSNIISAFSFLKYVNRTLSYQEIIDSFVSDKGTSITEEKMKLFVNYTKCSLPVIIKENKLIGSVDNMELIFIFNDNNNIGTYKMVFDEESIIEEELKYPLEKNVVTVFNIKSDRQLDINFNNKLFSSAKYATDIKDKVKKYFGKHSFISILFNEVYKNNYEYMLENVNEKFMLFINEFNKFSVSCKNSKLEESHLYSPTLLLEKLDEGIVGKDNLNILNNSEEVLNEFFSSLFSDIKGAFYEKEIIDNKIKYKLVFKKMISGEIRNIPYKLESTGTLKILEIFPYLYQAIKGETILIDEIDTGVHDLLMEFLITSMKEQMKGQMIITTHNTKLLESLKPEDVYVIIVDVDGRKKVLCVNEFGDRIQKKHNMNYRYLHGIFGGIPMTGYLDMLEIVDRAEKRKLPRNAK